MKAAVVRRFKQPLVIEERPIPTAGRATSSSASRVERDPSQRGRSRRHSVAGLRLRPLGRGLDGVVGVNGNLTWRFDDAAARHMPPLY